jgi:cell division protein FtsB
MFGALSLALILLACTTPVLAIIGVALFFRNRERNAQREHDLKGAIDQSAKTELKHELQKLRERVQVLEAIVTDGDYDLKQQFSKLEKHG